MGLGHAIGQNAPTLLGGGGARAVHRRAQRVEPGLVHRRQARGALARLCGRMNATSTTPLLDAWDGLTSPTRGSALRPRAFPSLIHTSDLSRAEARHLLATGALVPVRRGLLAHPPGATDPKTEREIHAVLAAARAALEYTRVPTAVSHLSAAMALGCWIFRPPRVAHITQATRVKGSSGKVRVVRHAGELPPADLRISGVVVVTSPIRTAIDVARTEPLARALPVLDSLLALGVDPTELAARADALGPVTGAPAARIAVEAARPVHAIGESVVRAYCIVLHLPPPETLCCIETPAGIWEGDLVWRGIKVAIEVDGALKLAGLEGEALTRALNRAAAREAALVKAGWVILHVTWSDLMNPAALQRKLVRLVRHRVA